MPIFQSTLLMRGATGSSARCVSTINFNPRSSCEERRPQGIGKSYILKFQSTLLMRGATRISLSTRSSVLLFQSTLLMRGATPGPSSHPARRRHFNPRSSCEERLAIFLFMVAMMSISIHAPHARSDAPFSIVSRSISAFQSTLLMRGATCCSWQADCSRRDFNPRSSCEERRKPNRAAFATSLFQSTLLMRGATGYKQAVRLVRTISIHAPHARSDPVCRRVEVQETISIHAPHARSDKNIKTPLRDADISIHAPHARSDSPFLRRYNPGDYFNPRSSCEERP